MSRIILALLGLILLIMIILSSGRISESLKSRVGLDSNKSEEKEIKASVTPEQENVMEASSGKEIPQTGIREIVYLFLSGGLLSGIALRKIKI